MKKIFLILILTINVFSTVKYVGRGGNDGNDGLTFNNRWGSLNYAFSTNNNNRIAPSETLAVSDSGYLLPFIIDSSVYVSYATNPTQNTMPLIIGCDSLGMLRDTSKTHIITSGILDSGLITFTKASAFYTKFKNLYMSGRGLTNFIVSTLSADLYNGMVFYNCKFDSSLSHIFNCQWAATKLGMWTFNKVEIAYSGLGGSGDAINMLSSSRGGIIFRNCKVHDILGNGIEMGGNFNSIVERCNFYRISGDAVVGVSSNVDYDVVNCTFNYIGSDAISIVNTSINSNIFNNCFTFCSGYGINTNSSTINNFKFIGFNCGYGNGANIDINSGVLPGRGNITLYPMYTDSANGDFTPLNNSPIINVGVKP